MSVHRDSSIGCIETRPALSKISRTCQADITHRQYYRVLMLAGAFNNGVVCMAGADPECV